MPKELLHVRSDTRASVRRKLYAVLPTKSRWWLCTPPNNSRQELNLCCKGLLDWMTTTRERFTTCIYCTRFWFSRSHMTRNLGYILHSTILIFLVKLNWSYCSSLCPHLFCFLISSYRTNRDRWQVTAIITYGFFLISAEVRQVVRSKGTCSDLETQFRSVTPCSTWPGVHLLRGPK
jgi:hypothetical protein